MNIQEIQDSKKAIYGKAVALNNGKREGCEEYLTLDEKRTLRELFFRSMIMSSILLRQENRIYDEGNQIWGETGIEYGVAAIGEKRAMEIWNEQKKIAN